MSMIRNILDAIKSNLISGGAYYTIAKGVMVTLLILFVAVVVAAAIGVVLSYYMSYEKKVISVLSQAISFLLRSTPVLLVLLLFYYVFFQRMHLSVTLISGLAIGLYGAGHFSEILARQVRVAKKTQDEIVIKRLQQVYFTVTLPQTIEDTYFLTKRLSILLLQWTTIVGYISVNDLTQVMDRIGHRTMYPFFAISFSILFYLVMAMFIEGIFSFLQRKSCLEDTVVEEEEDEEIEEQLMDDFTVTFPYEADDAEEAEEADVADEAREAEETVNVEQELNKSE